MEIIIGKTYRHSSGIEYKVTKCILDATGYEETGMVKKSVIYTQLVGGHYPAGTEWVRLEEDFIKNFVLAN